MPSPITIKLQCPKYLIEFVESYYQCKSPVLFRNGDEMNKFLVHFLSRPPRGYIEEKFQNGENFLEIIIPFLEEKNVLYNYFLSARAKKLFVSRLEIFFRIKFHEDVDKSVYEHFKIKDAILLFMDKYSLSPEIFEMLQKDYQRYKNKAYVKVCRRNKKKSVSFKPDLSIL